MLKRMEDDTNWNSLFLNPNTIIAEMEERFNIKKVKQILYKYIYYIYKILKLKNVKCINK